MAKAFKAPALPPDTAQLIVDLVLPALRDGASEPVACGIAGLKPWMVRQCCAELPELKSLYDDAMRDHANAKAEQLLTIHERDDLDAKRMTVASRNLTWWLEKRAPEYARKSSDDSADNGQVLGLLREAIQRIPRPDATALEPRSVVDITPDEPDEIDLDHTPIDDQSQRD